MTSQIFLVISSILLSVTGCINSSTEQTNLEGTIGKGDADVLFVKAREGSDSSWTFYVTVSHLDTGWGDYADGWDIVLPDGTVIKPDNTTVFTRTLLHPHVNEQPFTRSQSEIIIPEEVMKVRVRAHDIVDGYGGNEIAVDLKTEKGNGYEVIRMK